MRTINPSQLHTSSSASFSSTHTPSDPPSTPSSYAIELETIPLDQWSSWLKDVVQEDEPSALNITLTETWSEHKQDTARFDEAPSMTDSAMDVDPAEQRWPSQTPARQGIIPVSRHDGHSTAVDSCAQLSPFSPATPSPFDGPMFPVRAVTPILTSSPAVDSPLSEPLVVTPTTPNKRSAVPSLDSFIPLAQRRTRRNVSAPTRAHVDLKAVLGESSDDNDAGEVERRTKPAVKAPASPKRPPPRPSPDFDYTSSDESEDAYRQAKKPRVASASSGKSKGPSRKVYRRDPEKRRTQNEEAQRGYRQRRTAKFEAVSPQQPG